LIASPNDSSAAGAGAAKRIASANAMQMRNTVTVVRRMSRRFLRPIIVVTSGA
jgi:hypothetical protein